MLLTGVVVGAIIICLLIYIVASLSGCLQNNVAKKPSSSSDFPSESYVQPEDDEPSTTEEEITLDVKAFDGYRFVEHLTMYSDDFDAANSYENPDVIKPVVCGETQCRDGKLTATLKKLSWNMFRFEKI